LVALPAARRRDAAAASRDTLVLAAAASLVAAGPEHRAAPLGAKSPRYQADVGLMLTLGLDRIPASAPLVYPDDPDFTRLWGLSNTYQSGGVPGADIGAPEAWSTTTGSAAAPACSRAPSAPRCRGPASRRDPRRTPGERSGGFRRFSFGSTLGADSRSTRERGV